MLDFVTENLLEIWAVILLMITVMAGVAMLAGDSSAAPAVIGAALGHMLCAGMALGFRHADGRYPFRR